jgi:uncharacterized membrane protein YhhN
MNILLIAALVFAALEALAVSKNWLRLEYLSKPAVMIALFFWLRASAGANGALFWFELGILFSLAGDVLLMFPTSRLFLAGLFAFLLAHIAYIVGFNIPLPQLSFWGFFLLIMIGLGGVRVARRIVQPLAAQGQAALRLPIIAYSVFISLMLLSAMMKLNDLTWKANAAILVSSGALFFYVSDIILAWNKFVSPIRHGRLYNIITYHLGQIALIAGVIVQFGS